MKKLFNHILVPVSFNGNTTAVLEKALQVANRFDCDVHLLYVQPAVIPIPFVNDNSLMSGLINENEKEASIKLKALENESRAALADGLLVTSTIAFGNWYAVIKEQVITRHIDLLVLPKHEKKFAGEMLYKIDINHLAQQTQCPVLTVTEDFDAGHLQNIVVPVDDFLPIKKLAAATYLARKFNGVVHLMGGRGDSYAEDKKKARCLTRAYQLLNDYTNVKVHCATQASKAEDTLAYAHNVNADLIVVNSGKESLFRGWFSKWMRKYMYKKSTIPILTISPG